MTNKQTRAFDVQDFLSHHSFESDATEAWYFQNDNDDEVKLLCSVAAPSPPPPPKIFYYSCRKCSYSTQSKDVIIFHFKTYHSS